MDTIRKNTVVVDFSVLPTRPNAAEVHKFLVHQIQLDIATVKNLQLHNIRHQALIELHHLETAEGLATAHNLKHSVQVGNKKFLIPVFLEDTAINVRVHDLPPDMPNKDVADHMKQYGLVKSVVREVWKKYFPGTPNGVRVVRIELQKHIPSYIQIHDQMSLVSYRNQPTTCRSCSQRTHPNMKCSEAAGTAQQHTTNKPLQVHGKQPHASTNDANNKADNKTEQVKESKRKRDHSTVSQLPGIHEIEINAETSNADKMETEDWIIYHKNKLDRIIENNKNLLKKCDMVKSVKLSK